MKTLKQLQEENIEIEKQIELLEQEENIEIEKQIELLEQEENIVYQDENFKVIKWENKELGDFPMPSGYEWASYFNTIELINDKKLKFTKPYEETYICKTQFKQNKKYPLSRLCLYDDLGLGSAYASLGGSDDSGRVVMSKIKEIN